MLHDSIIAALIGVGGVLVVQTAVLIHWTGKSDERQKNTETAVSEMKSDLKAGLGQIAALTPQVERFKDMLDTLDRVSVVPQLATTRRRKPPASAAA